MEIPPTIWTKAAEEPEWTAIEYANGSTRKVAKLSSECTPQEKLHEEVSDLVMMGLALARVDGLTIEDVLINIKNKLILREGEYQKSLGEHGKPVGEILND